MFHALLADAVLLLHAAVVLFVVVGLPLIVAGNLRGWAWVNAMAFRIGHLAAIVVVAAQAWLGVACPLTVLEDWLRGQAGETRYAGGFVAHWLHRLLFYAFPDWVFTLAYTLFALLVAAAWWRFPPRRAARASLRRAATGRSGTR